MLSVLQVSSELNTKMVQTDLDKLFMAINIRFLIKPLAAYIITLAGLLPHYLVVIL